MDRIAESQLDGVRDEQMVHITFDDGYAENLDFAIPLLLKKQIPFTYFVTTKYIESGEPYPHDLKLGLKLSPNNVEQIKTLACTGVEIGAHTHTHVDLGSQLPAHELKREIHDVRKRLQDWTGQSVRYFAFPYGMVKNMTQAAIDAVFEAGFDSFVSAFGGMNFPGENPHHLKRIHGDPGIASLKNWLTFDPRKIHRTVEFPFEIPLAKSNKTNTSVKAQSDVAIGYR